MGDSSDETGHRGRRNMDQHTAKSGGEGGDEARGWAMVGMMGVSEASGVVVLSGEACTSGKKRQ